MKSITDRIQLTHDNNINYNNLTFVDLRIKDRVSLKYKQVD